MPTTNVNPTFIYGRNPVLEALRAGEQLDQVLVARGVSKQGAVGQILQRAKAADIPVKWVPRAALDRTVRGQGSGNHQGVVAHVSSFRYHDLAEILAVAIRRGEPPFLLVLDAIQDVHNLGSLIRTAEAAGVHGVVIPPRKAAAITPAVHKASAGAVMHVAVARVDLAGALDTLRDRDIWVIGLDGDADRDYLQADLTGAVALVVGAESRGLSRAVADRCDDLVRLPMHGRVASLNAAVAGSIALYEALRQRGPKPATIP